MGALISRPKMALWLWQRGLSAADLGRQTNSSRQAATNWLRPFDDPRRVIPSEEVMGICHVWTSGGVMAQDWHRPELAGRQHAFADDVVPHLDEAVG